MKISIEQHIKTQLKDKELPVSEGAWDRLVEQLEVETPTMVSKPKKWIPYSIAATVVLLIGWKIMQNETVVKSKPTTVQKEASDFSLVNEMNQPEQSIMETKVAIPEKVVVDQSTHSHKQKIEKQMGGNIKSMDIANQNVEVVKEIQIQTQEKNPKELELNNTPTQLVKSEIEKPEKNYADPQMLLYSIENNSAVKTVKKPNSRLVIVDFNQ